MNVEIKEAQKVIHAGLAWANWTDEQQSAMRKALDCMMKVEQIRKEANDLYNEEIDLTDFGERVSNII
ncbi:hypothetical protein OR571_13350 [Psychrobacillus sp. NEAU-3TGS]|uniref:hypothetical protein n=1 Tax=Psychrobacillus sp. NEAU-3TGS TaxID=2995412 RepID=UPI002497ED12|nr:hypothetical protein [Psychrobacillus sp. NEAU-3TGS]MDI2588074.1 hypothetical protein [Psychrobacillus sp. NEAU-3TGS]